MTGIPTKRIAQSEGAKLLTMSADIKRRVIGQGNGYSVICTRGTASSITSIVRKKTVAHIAIMIFTQACRCVDAFNAYYSRPEIQAVSPQLALSTFQLLLAMPSSSATTEFLRRQGPFNISSIANGSRYHQYYFSSSPLLSTAAMPACQPQRL